jgi:carnitine O-acetyltransferase
MNVNSAAEWSTRTFGNEDRLPRVPLPTLAESCERFLAWCAPLLTADELAATEAAVASFRRPGSSAHTLQAALERYNSTEGVHSWLDTFWPSRYLGRRDRIALNANFFFLFNGADQPQVARAAGLIAAAVDYKLLLDEELVPPVVQRGQPLSMEQLKFLFSTTRIPGAGQDTVRAPYTAQWPGPSRARHIVVFFRGNMFRLDVLDPGGRRYPPDDLEAGLRAVMRAGALPAAPRARPRTHRKTIRDSRDRPRTTTWSGARSASGARSDSDRPPVRRRCRCSTTTCTRSCRPKTPS